MYYIQAQKYMVESSRIHLTREKKQSAVKSTLYTSESHYDINGLVQDCSISRVSAMETL